MHHGGASERHQASKNTCEFPLLERRSIQLSQPCRYGTTALAILGKKWASSRSLEDDRAPVHGLLGVSDDLGYPRLTFRIRVALQLFCLPHILILAGSGGGGTRLWILFASKPAPTITTNFRSCLKVCGEMDLDLRPLIPADPLHTYLTLWVYTRFTP